MITVGTSGERPKALNFSTEKALLVAAWAYGLKENDAIHRLALFAFVQSHITNATEENLQGFIERDSSNWQSSGNGYYRLTSSAFQETRAFGQPNSILPKGIVYTFKRKIPDYEISVTVDSIRRKYTTKQNNTVANADTIIKNIKRITNDYVPTSMTSKPRKVFNWILEGSDYAWSIETEIKEAISPQLADEPKDLDDEETFPEGREKYRIHKSKERKQKLVALKKQKALSQDQNLPCNICGFSFKRQYGKIGDKFIEAHHILPLSQLREDTETKLDDLILVCSNCHKMIHRRRPWLSVGEIKKLLVTEQ